jgi:hypothetical protein
MLLARPHPPRIETVNDVAGGVTNAWRAIDPRRGQPEAVADVVCEIINDIDPYLANVFRSIQGDPEGVVDWCDQPVNELNLHSSHRWLVLGEGAREFRERMRRDFDYFDVKYAGLFIAGICCWIGAGFAVAPEDGPGHGPHGGSGERLPMIGGGGAATGVHAGADVPAARDLQSKARIGGDNKGSVGKGVHAGGPGGQLPAIGRGGDGRGPGSGMKGVHQDLPEGHAGGGPSEKLPLIGGSVNGPKYGQGVHAKGDLPDSHRPQLADAYAAGRGVHAGPQGGGLHEKRPDLRGHDTGTAGRGVNSGSDGGALGHGASAHVRDYSGGTCAARRAWLLDWFGRLRDRLRCVRVCAGSWERVCSSESVTTRLGTTGIFFDPPYPSKRPDGTHSRTDGIYASDGGKMSPDQIRDDLLAYCLERGPDPKMRLCVAFYEGDGYEALLKEGWDMVSWRAAGGYGNRSKKGKANAARERLIFSPHCNKEKSLFDGLGNGQVD